jgi:16S rRNA (uracil1498-N3)-methyltransferase
MIQYSNLKRVFLEEILSSGALSAIVSPEKRHHLQAVLKIRKGDQLRVFNSNCGEWLAIVKNITNKAILIEVSAQLRLPEAASSNIILALAPIKHHRLGIAIEKCTEIGVDSFVPLITERTTSPHFKHNKLQAYILNATEQSERILQPTLQEPLNLDKFLEEYADDNLIACDSRCDAAPILNLLRVIDKSKRIVIAIGPEGGFSEKELAIMASKGAQIASLGHNILRSETAAIFALSCAMAAL